MPACGNRRWHKTMLDRFIMPVITIVKLLRSSMRFVQFSLTIDVSYLKLTHVVRRD